jgi:hypothetical protein
MSWKDRQLGGTRMANMTPTGLLTLTGTPSTTSVAAPSSTVVGFIQNSRLGDWVSTAEVWRPTGVQLVTTTSTTVTVPILTLQKGTIANASFAAASAGGVATSALRTAPFSEYIPFTNYVTSANVSNFTADAAGDNWRVNVSTSPTAGAAAIFLHYVLIGVAGVSDAVTTL